jgi:hypothetical protein
MNGVNSRHGKKQKEASRYSSKNNIKTEAYSDNMQLEQMMR